MKLKVWAVVDVHCYGGEVDVDEVKLYMTKKEAEDQGKWYVVETELDLGSLITGTDIEFTI